MNGTIEAEGIELIPTYSHPAETFWRQLKFGEFEVAEMSMSSFLIARSQGADMIALPVFQAAAYFKPSFPTTSIQGSPNPKTLPANVWAWRSINRRRRCGYGAFWSMTSASPSTRFTGTWSAARR